MKNRFVTPLSIVLLVIGVLNALALYAGLAGLNRTVRDKFLPSSSTSINQDGMVLLSNDRFAVVKDGRISIFRVDAQNRVIRVNDVSTDEKTLKPWKYYN